MAIRPARDDAVTALLKRSGQRSGVSHHLVGVIAKLLGHGQAEGHGLPRHEVHVHRALHPREDGGINLVGEFLPAEDDPATGTTERFISGESNEIGVGYRGGIRSTSYQPGVVSHISQEIGANLICDLAEFGEVNSHGISTAPADDHLRPPFGSNGHYLIIVNQF